MLHYFVPYILCDSPLHILIVVPHQLYCTTCIILYHIVCLLSSWFYSEISSLKSVDRGSLTCRDCYYFLEEDCIFPEKKIYV